MRYAATILENRQGFQRTVIAHKNQARYDMLAKAYVQSFASCYRIIESGDYFEPAKDPLDKHVRREMEFKRISEDQLDWT